MFLVFFSFSIFYPHVLPAVSLSSLTFLPQNSSRQPSAHEPLWDPALVPLNGRAGGPGGQSGHLEGLVHSLTVVVIRSKRGL